MSNIVDEIGRRGTKAQVAEFRIGDTVDVHVRIVEGDKERVQVFTGTVVARKGGGPRECFTVRRIVQGEGVERVFPLHSPRIEKIEVRRTGRVRRAKLHYLRARTGKGTRLAERREGGEESAADASAEDIRPDEAASPNPDDAQAGAE